MDVKILWSNFLNSIKNELSPITYETWFKETDLYSLSDGKAIIIVPMHLHKQHLAERYYDFIVDKFSDISGGTYEFEFVLKDEVKKTILNLDDHQQEIFDDKDNEIGSVGCNLKSSYSFDTFIVGNSNKFAHAAALSVAEDPGKISYRP